VTDPVSLHGPGGTPKARTVKRMEAATKPGAVRAEIVRRIYAERLIDRDPKRLLDEFATPDIEYVDPAEAVDPGTRRGRAEVGRALRRARQSFPSYEHELDEVFDRGDAVVAAVTFRGGRRGSQSEIVERRAHTWTLREGRIVRFEWGRDLEAALQAAGLREWE
jgi:ketosteroid isomerase-like protein